MKLKVWAILVFALAAVFQAFGQKQKEKAAQQLKSFESDWLPASLNQDKTWFEQFLEGRLKAVPVEKDSITNRQRATVELIDPKLKPGEMKFRISGTITMPANGGNRSFYFLDTFNLRGGKWEVIATHFSQTPPPEKTENAEQTIIEMERERRRMIIEKDSAGLRRIIAEDFSAADASGRISDKAQFINSIESFEMPPANVEDLKVKIYGETAVVTGKFPSKTEIKDDRSNRKTLFTAVWVKRAAQWQMVNYQATQIK